MTQVMGHENCLWQYKFDCMQLAYARHCIRASKANQSGFQNRVAQLLFYIL
jgi:hypothetical protein